MSWLANLCYLVAGLLYLPVLLYQMLMQGKNRHGWAERFGHVQARSGDGLCIWIHAVSLGEINATRKLVEQLRADLPEVEIVISTTTDTGFVRAKQLYPELACFRYPLDFSWVIRRVLRRIRPSVIVLMELELWYNLVTLADGRGVKVCVANGRFTHQSHGRMKLIGPLVRPMFRRLSWVGAQTEKIAARFREMGAFDDRVEVVGSMKWDTAEVTDRVAGAEELAAAMGIGADRSLVVLGSSGPGEEEQVVSAFHSGEAALNGATLAIVPRKPERFDEVARLLEKTCGRCVRRSATPDGTAPRSSESAVLLGDTMGELRKFYSLADVVLIGRTLVPMGGSDPMEVAALGKPIIVGPYTENFADAIDKLQEAGAIALVNSPEELRARLGELLVDSKRREEMGERARSVVRQNQGATQRTLARLRQLLEQSNRSNC